jgi:alpha-N-arabinofuranosidase
MLLIDELQTEPIWVINNGVAHADSVAPAAVWSLVQDALDSLEFISGDEHTPWGAVRAAMGRPKPWPPLRYITIGNEDCGKPWYLENYLLFAGALKAAAPELQLISNCDLGPAAPADLFDWHMYTSPQSMFDLRTVFDDRKPDAPGQPKVFASEYAVTDGGGLGNLAAAVAEAAFMTGMERNGGAVAAAAYAPLFVRTQDRPWPTDLIVFDGESWFGIPSYHVQRMFRETQGMAYAATATGGAPGAAAALAASATCQDPSCSDVVLKVVNFGADGVNVSVAVRRGGKGAGVQAGAAGLVLTGAAPEEENSFEDPMKVAPVEVELDEVGDEFALELAPWSVNLVRLKVGASPQLGGGSGGGDVAAVA